jgi:hypothetical protein
VIRGGMRLALRLHPDSRCAAVRRIEAEVERPRAGGLTLTYIVIGSIGELRLPSVRPTVRANELWLHTCFEAFLGTSPSAAYYEFNFAPSTQWAAYRFDGYRNGMRAAGEISAPRIEVQSAATRYTLRATLELEGSRLPGTAAWHLGLAAVIEETSGIKSYWALAHPPGKPDFHHADCFTLHLPPA